MSLPKQIDTTYRGGEDMAITPEQRAYARLAGVMFLLNYVLQSIGDGVTLQSRGGESFA